MKGKRLGRRICIVITVLCCILCLGGASAQAASQKENALAAYKAALETKSFRIYEQDPYSKADSFCLMNLDKDTVPELFVKCYLEGGFGGSKGYLVYTYKNGQVQQIGVVAGAATNTKAYYYKKAKVIREDWTRWGMTSRRFWKLKSSKLQTNLGYSKYEQEVTKYSYNGSYVTKSKYKAKVKALVGSEKAINVETLLEKNTASNRQKYLAGDGVTIKLNKTSHTLTLGKTASVKLKATVTGSTKKVKWSSSNKKIATVSSSGKVRAKKAGTVTITAKVGKTTVQCKITVKESAKIQNKKAMAAYKKMLANTKFWNWDNTWKKADTFYLLDLNGDGVKEILISLDEKIRKLYTYENGKITLLEDLHLGGYASSISYYPSKRVLQFEQNFAGSYVNRYYVMKGTSLVNITNPNLTNQTKIRVAEKSRRNTSANRKKYLK